jgi:hypothetical protein
MSYMMGPQNTSLCADDSDREAYLAATRFSASNSAFVHFLLVC